MDLVSAKFGGVSSNEVSNGRISNSAIWKVDVSIC